MAKIHLTLKERESLYEIVSFRWYVCLSVCPSSVPFFGPSVTKCTSASLHFHSVCMSARNRPITIGCVHANLCHCICLKTLAGGSWGLAGGSWGLARGPWSLVGGRMYGRMDVRTKYSLLYRAPPFWATAQKGLTISSSFCIFIFSDMYNLASP